MQRQIKKYASIQQWAILAACMIYACIISIPGLLKGYSLWVDELFTVAFINAPWAEMFSEWILPDVHPPLYFVLAKLWSIPFGISEVALRSFSFTFTIGTIILLWAWQRHENNSQGLVLLLLTTTNPFFLYYSQEARPYALLIFLCCLLTILNIKIKRQPERRGPKSKAGLRQLAIWTAYVATSLTHFFGFLYSFVLISLELLTKKKSSHKRAAAITLGSILIWPVYHLGFVGNLGSTQKEQIKLIAQPLWDPIQAYIMVNIPYINSGKAWIDQTITACLLMVTILYLCAAAKNWLADSYPGREIKMDTRDWVQFKYSSSIILAALLIITAVNIYSPVTTYRNLTILIFATNVCISCVLANIIRINRGENHELPSIKTAKGVVGTLFLTFILVVSAKISVLNLEAKQTDMSYKILATYLNSTSICKVDSCYIADYDPDTTDWGGRIWDYYFGNHQLTSLKKFSSKDQNDGGKNKPIIGSGINMTKKQIYDLAKTYDYNIIGRLCNPDNNNSSMPFVLLKEFQSPNTTTSDLKKPACIN